MVKKLVAFQFDDEDFKLIKQIQDETGISNKKDTLRYALRQTALNTKEDKL